MNARTIATLVIVFLISATLAATGSYMVWSQYHASASVRAQTGTTSAVANGGTGGRPPVNGVVPDLSIEYVVLHRDGLSAAFRIRNNSRKPVTISQVIYNDEFVASKAREDDDFWRDESQWPATITIGDHTFSLVQDGYMTRFYHKDILFIDIYTDLGAFRYKPSISSWLLEGPTPQDEVR